MRATLTAIAAAFTLAGLCACGRSQDATQAAPPPADAPAAPADFSRPLNALGNEPFWSLKIRAEGLTFSAPDLQDVTAPNPGPQAEAKRAVWTAGGSDGAPVTATLAEQACQDSMSGAVYPFAAEVRAAGRTWTGCAAYADAMPKPE